MHAVTNKHSLLHAMSSIRVCMRYMQGKKRDSPRWGGDLGGPKEFAGCGGLVGLAPGDGCCCLCCCCCRFRCWWWNSAGRGCGAGPSVARGGLARWRLLWEALCGGSVSCGAVPSTLLQPSHHPSPSANPLSLPPPPPPLLHSMIASAPPHGSARVDTIDDISAAPLFSVSLCRRAWYCVPLTATHAALAPIFELGLVCKKNTEHVRAPLPAEAKNYAPGALHNIFFWRGVTLFQNLEQRKGNYIKVCNLQRTRSARIA